MRRFIDKIDVDWEDVAVLFGTGLLCGGLFMVYQPAAFIVAGLVILVPRFLKYLPGGKES